MVGSFISSRIWGPSKNTCFDVSYVSLGNFVQRYLKHSPALPKALTNCFINPNLTGDGGNGTFSLFIYVLSLPNKHFAIFYLSSGVALLWYPTSKESKDISCCRRSMDNSFKSSYITTMFGKFDSVEMSYHIFL